MILHGTGKIRSVLVGLRGGICIADLCHRESINRNQYYGWSQDFREANTDEVYYLKQENKDLKQAVAELYLRNDWFKKV